MGKQIQFYMTPEDEAAFLTTIKEKCGAQVVYNVFESIDRMLAEPIPALGTNLPYDNNLSLLPDSFRPRLVLHAYQGFSRLSLAASECIEFTRSVAVANQYQPGRLWYDPQRENGSPKRIVFLRWADSVFRHIRRQLSRNPASGNRHCGTVILGKLEQGLITLAPY